VCDLSLLVRWLTAGGWELLCLARCGGGGIVAPDESRRADAGVDRPAVSDATMAADVAPEAGLPSSAFKLSDAGALRLQIASDRTGAPVVMWTDRTGNESAYWDQAAGQWVPMATLGGGNPTLIEPGGSGRGLVRWPVEQDAGLMNSAAQRFDPTRGSWGALVGLPGPTPAPYDWQMAVDGAGNAHSVWREGGGYAYWSWWRADGPGWEPTVALDESYTLAVTPAASFIWFNRNTLGVRQFDAVAGGWSDTVQLADLTQESDLRVHQLAVGRDGAPLMTSLRRDPDQLVVEAWRGQPEPNVWGARELIETVPVSSDPNTLEGMVGALADPLGDLFWVPIPLADGSFDQHVERYDPAQGAWALSRVIHGAAGTGAPVVDLRADSQGRVYGCSNAGLLMRFDPATAAWQDTTPGMVGGAILRTSDGGAFVAGFADGNHLVAFRSDAGGTWRPVSGYRGGAQPSVGSIPYAMEIAGADRAVLAWTVDEGPDTGVWVAFIE